MMVLASSGSGFIQLLLGGFGITGLVGAGVALFKLRPDVNSAAVIQAEGAMRMMQGLNQELEAALERANTRADYYRGLADACKEKCLELERRLREINLKWGPFDDEG